VSTGDADACAGAGAVWAADRAGSDTAATTAVPSTTSAHDDHRVISLRLNL